MRACFGFLIFIFVSATTAFGWGKGHETHAKLVFENLPKEIADFFGNDGGKSLAKWSKFPDGHKKHAQNTEVVKALGIDEAQALDGIFKSQFFWHSSEGKCAAFAMLAKAFREKRKEAAEFYAGCLLHSVADSSAFNHGPLVHVLTYFNYNKDAFPKVDLDLYVYNSSQAIRDEIGAMLKDFKPAPLEGGFDNIFGQILFSEWEDAAFLAGIESKLLEPAKDGEKYSRGYIECMSATAARQTRSGANLVCSAWNLAADNGPIPQGKPFIGKETKDRAAKQISQFVASKKLSDDSVYDGLFDDTPNGKKSIVFVAECSSLMGGAKLGFSNRFLAAIAARSLKNAGKPVKLADLKEIEKKYPSADECPVLVLPVSAHIPNRKGFLEYMDSGGKVLILGGTNAAIPGLEKNFSRRDNSETPVSTKYGKANEEQIKLMSVVFAPPFAESVGLKHAPFKCNPNTPAGWGKPVSNLEILISDKVVPLANLEYGPEAKSYCICAALKGDDGKIRALWLPQYMLMPMLFTDKSERMKDWSRPELDSFSRRVFFGCVELLENAGAKN